MKHGSLFSGIGGFDLAAEWMGWANIFHCEWNPFGQKVLKHYWPNAISYTDITKTDFSIHRGKIDIITGGFPCQTFSVAGKGECDLTLWKEMFRAIREIRPANVVAENVLGLVSQQNGMAFEQVCADLESVGYEVQPLNIPAASKGAPHQRERIWVVAYSDKFRCNYEQKENGKFISDQKQHAEIKKQKRNEQQCRFIESNSNATDSEIIGLQRSIKTNGSEGKKCNDKFSYGCNREWEQSAVEVATRLCGMDARIPNRVDKIKALGNAIVPQVAYEIFKAIEQNN